MYDQKSQHGPSEVTPKTLPTENIPVWNIDIEYFVTFYHESRKSCMHIKLWIDPISWTVNITSGDYELAS